MTAISVKGLGKKYKMFSSPSESLKELLHPFGKKYHKEFWALRNISFEIDKGQCVGIVGCNGCGKSTLLQMLCRVFQPTEGSVEVNGRISALLELGAGFNPDFTGRDNVYLNGALMGITREEMDERFQRIADFADIGDFIEQPVKIYSSGMYVRLAFAVAINVDPDILIVDEALSVGDEAFQRKCFARIEQLKKNEATILFVSHAASTVVELCDWAMLLDGGELIMTGSAKAVVSRYHKIMAAPPEMRASICQETRVLALGRDKANKDACVTNNIEKNGLSAFYDPNLKSQSAIKYASLGAEIKNPKITTIEGKQVNILVRGEEYIYSYEAHFSEPAMSVRFGMLIKTITGFELGGRVSHSQYDAIEYVEKGVVMRPEFTFRCSLAAGVYFMNAGVRGTVNGRDVPLHRCLDLVMFRVQLESLQLMTGIVDFNIDASIKLVNEVADAV